MSNILDTTQVKVGKVALRVMLTQTKNGTDGWKYRSESSGKTLPNLSTLDNVEKVPVTFGTVETSFNRKTGKNGDYLVARFYNVELNDRKATITVKCAADGSGEYRWSVSGTFPTGGKRGRSKAPATDGSEF